MTNFGIAYECEHRGAEVRSISCCGNKVAVTACAYPDNASAECVLYPLSVKHERENKGPVHACSTCEWRTAPERPESVQAPMPPTPANPARLAKVKGRYTAARQRRIEAARQADQQAREANHVRDSAALDRPL